MKVISLPAHEDFPEIVREAAQWYANTGRSVEIPAVIVLRSRFGLTALQACEAIALAQKLPPNLRSAG